MHLSAEEPPQLEGAGPLSRETAERLTCDARRLALKPRGRDLVHSRVSRSPHCQYPDCSATRELEAQLARSPPAASVATRE